MQPQIYSSVPATKSFIDGYQDRNYTNPNTKSNVQENLGFPVYGSKFMPKSPAIQPNLMVQPVSSFQLSPQGSQKRIIVNFSSASKTWVVWLNISMCFMTIIKIILIFHFQPVFPPKWFSWRFVVWIQLCLVWTRRWVLSDWVYYWVWWGRWLIFLWFSWFLDLKKFKLGLAVCLWFLIYWL